ncbi:uncharacterized protein LOC133278191 [Pezoporus flaviventris]|uniref:uncharacterized protein LOC133278191 n=1 Tax=Pezoporus flaviventris TaxID=889875 RepID=UPI002AAF167B|nr:uncharacterized protein LOC133278191 [Pezoporus flaviventris]
MLPPRVVLWAPRLLGWLHPCPVQVRGSQSFPHPCGSRIRPCIHTALCYCVIDAVLQHRELPCTSLKNSIYCYNEHRRLGRERWSRGGASLFIQTAKKDNLTRDDIYPADRSCFPSESSGGSAQVLPRHHLVELSLGNLSFSIQVPADEVKQQIKGGSSSSCDGKELVGSCAEEMGSSSRYLGSGLNKTSHRHKVETCPATSCKGYQSSDGSSLSYIVYKGSCMFNWKMDVLQTIGLDAIKGRVTCDLKDLVTCRVMV